MISDLRKAMVRLEEEAVLSWVDEEAAKGAEPAKIVEALRQAMTEIGRLYEEDEYFLAELVMAAEIFKSAFAILEPLMVRKSVGKPLGRILIGTVSGDFHDIGKNIVATLLQCSGFEVTDLGVDVSPGVFCARLEEQSFHIVGMSALLTTAYEPMKITVARIRALGLSPAPAILIGGGVMNQSVVDYVGADGFARDAVAALSLCKKHVQSRIKQCY